MKRLGLPISRWIVAHRQILQRGPPSYFSVAGKAQFSFCNSRGGHFEPHWFGKWAQSAQLYISRGCLSLFCILHRVGILQPSPRAPVYYRPNQYTEQNIEHEQNTEHDVLKLALQPPRAPVYYGSNLQPTELNIMMQMF